MLPVGAPEYAEGYGLDRLRELALAALTSDAARDRTHLHQSLAMLFRLVNDGYPPETLGPDGIAEPPATTAAGCGSRRCAPTSSPRAPPR